MSGNTSTYGRLPANVTLKNTVFTHSALMPIFVQTDFERDKNRKDERRQYHWLSRRLDVGRYEKTGYKDHFINVEGFLDIYNWINIEDFSSTSGLVPSTGIESVDAIVGTSGSANYRKRTFTARIFRSKAYFQRSGIRASRHRRSRHDRARYRRHSTRL